MEGRMDNTAKQITGKDVERVVFTNKESQDITRKSLTYWQDVRRRFLKNKLAILGAVIIVCMVFFALFGYILTSQNYHDQDLSMTNLPPRLETYRMDDETLLYVNSEYSLYTVDNEGKVMERLEASDDDQMMREKTFEVDGNQVVVNYSGAAKVAKAKKEGDIMENIRKNQASCISGKDMMIPEEASRFFGIYHLDGDYIRNLAMPIWHWGKFYEQLIRTIMDGTWKYDDAPSTKKAINYWWGMSEGVIDVVFSKYLPIGLKRLAGLLKASISADLFNPFSGILYSQTGAVSENPDKILSPEEIMTMDWLAENVIGSFPKKEELKEQAEPVMKQQGIKKQEG